MVNVLGKILQINFEIMMDELVAHADNLAKRNIRMLFAEVIR